MSWTLDLLHAVVPLAGGTTAGDRDVSICVMYADADTPSFSNSLITFLSKEDHIKSLLQWVVAGLDELDQAAEKSDSASFKHALASPHVFPSFHLTPAPVPASASAPGAGPGSPPLEPAKMVDEVASESSSAGDETPYSPDLPAALGQGLGSREGDDDTKRARSASPLSSAAGTT